MFGCECFCWEWDSLSVSDLYPLQEPHPFSLPSPLPQWPQGQGFATGKINLGELEVINVSKFQSILNCNPRRGKGGVTFYRPVGIQDGFFPFGHYCQPNDQPLRGYVLAAREVELKELNSDCLHQSVSQSPPLTKPVNYTLIWSSKSPHEECAYIWLPNAPGGYKALGFIVTNEPNEPNIDEVRCVRDDLTHTRETCDMILNTVLTSSPDPLRVWNTRPCERGMFCSGVDVGTFFCSTSIILGDELEISCLKNLDSSLHAMPNLDQIHALIKHYGPTVFFHPDEVYLPSSVPWFFKNGALLCRNDKCKGESIDSNGFKLPKGGENDGEFWLDLPDDKDQREYLKNGNIGSAEFYVHVKPASGGSFTDIVMWVFCPFNGPATLKAGVVNIPMNKVGEHVGDWEHFTLRINNFSGELWSMYFSEHSGGEWLNAFDLEFINGNKSTVYLSKCGHASYPHPGTYIQGSSKLGIGLRNDVARSKNVMDASSKYQIVAAEYLGDEVAEPDWLQYMREWGPTIVYDARAEIGKIINRLPFFFRFSAETLIELFPTEIYGEEGPTGPKEKDNWYGDERSRGTSYSKKNFW